MKVKICCIASVGEAHLAVAAGASALGLVSAMPSGPGVIDEATIAQIAAAVAPPTETFLLTCHRTADTIGAQHARCRTTTIQLVDELPHDELRRLRHLLPEVRLVQVIHVAGEASIAQATGVAPLVDALLLDSGNPLLAVKELGGTGRTRDWTISRRIRDAIEVPLYLAGGLNAGNVAEAITAVQPFGIDVCSSVRTDGQLDAGKLAALFAALQEPSMPTPGLGARIRARFAALGDVRSPIEAHDPVRPTPSPDEAPGAKKSAKRMPGAHSKRRR
jgi:phosphoribosylanthranilate isomerase